MWVNDQAFILPPPKKKQGHLTNWSDCCLWFQGNLFEKGVWGFSRPQPYELVFYFFYFFCFFPQKRGPYRQTTTIKALHRIALSKSLKLVFSPLPLFIIEVGKMKITPLKSITLFFVKDYVHIVLGSQRKSFIELKALLALLPLHVWAK